MLSSWLHKALLQSAEAKMLPFSRLNYSNDISAVSGTDSDGYEKEKSDVVRARQKNI